MAVRTRKLICLDLSSLKSFPKSVGSPSNGVARRTFLAGAAAATVAASSTGKALANGLAAGSLRVRRKTGRDGRLKSVSIYVDANHVWTVDTSLYDGDPILTLEENARAMVLRLAGAFLPGTRFAVNFEATISQNLFDRRVRFAFTETGVTPSDFQLEAPFDAWVRGEKSAIGDLPAGLLEGGAGLHDEVTVRAEGPIAYRPDGSFQFAGAGEFIGVGRRLPIRDLSLTPERAAEVLLQTDGSQTRITARREGAWKGEFVFEAEGWKSSGSIRKFDGLDVALPTLTAALATLGADDRLGLAIESLGGTRLALRQARLSTLVQPDHRADVLTAKIDDQGAWIPFRGASLEVGPYGEDAEVLFAQVQSPEGESTYADIQAGIRNAAFEVDGAVTKTRTNGVEPITLAMTELDQGNATQIRPGAIQRNPGNLVVQPPAGQTPGVAGRLDITAVTKFRLVPFRLDVSRREDMLSLSFEFVNLSFQSGAAAPTLVKSDPAKPSYLVVNFPPQALAEAHFFEDRITQPLYDDGSGGPKLSANSGVSRRPIDSRLSGESKLVFWIPTAVNSILFSIKGDDGNGRNGLLDWARLKPSVTATAIQTYGAPKIRIDSAFINPIDSISVKRAAALTGGVRITPPPSAEEEDPGFVGAMRKLAARRGPSAQGNLNRPLIQGPGVANAIQAQPKTNVTGQLGRLVQGFDPTLTFRFIPKGRMEPNALHTQIEMPVRVILSPHENAGWMHTAGLPQSPPSGKFAMWHTRLGHKIEPATAGGEHSLQMFSDDGKSFYRVSPSKTEGPFFSLVRSSPTVRVIDAVDYINPKPSTAANDPNPIVRKISSPIRVEYPMTLYDRCELVDSMCYRGERNDDSDPFDIENLILSPLGGYLKGEWVWRKPLNWPATSPEPQLRSWRHVSTLGRDHYMKLVRAGYLWPTGHKAVMITISERKFQTTTEGKVVAYVRTREYVAVRDPLITLSGAEINALGFSSLTLLTNETPVLDMAIPATANYPTGTIQDNLVLKWLYSGGQPVMFKVRGVDQDGQNIQWSMPMVFVFQAANQNELARLDRLKAAYDNETKTIPSGQRRANLFGQMVAFAPGGGKGAGNQDAEGNTRYPCKNMLITAVVNGRGPAQSWVQDAARWRPVLHTANIAAPAVQMMQGKPPALGAIHLPDEMFDMDELQASTEAMLAYDDADGFDVKIPEVFKQNGFGSGNKSQMFLELLEKVGPEFGDTSKTGGIANPNMLIQGLSKGKGPIGGALNDILNGNVNPKDLLDTGARLLGAVKIFDILPNPIKIDPGGSDAPYIELLLIYDDGKNKPPTGAKVSVIWKPPLKNWGFDNQPPLFYVNNFKKEPAGDKPFGNGTGELKLEGSIKTKFKGGDKPEMVFKGEINNFRVDLISPASFLIIDFEKIEFIAEVGKPFDVNVDMKKMTFTGPLTFVQKLQDLVNGDDGMNVSNDPNAALPVRTSALSTADPGLEVYLDVDETGIRAGLTFTVPTISCGMLAIRNIFLGVKLTLPFFGDPLSVRFNFCERNNTFQLSYMGVTGGGFVALELNIDGEMIFEAAFEVGGSLSFDIGVASGGVSIMAGIYFRLENKDCMLEAYIRINGNLSVLGLIRINLEFYLSLTYYSDGNRLVGTASVTIEIEILFFSVSVTATVQRTLTGEKSGSVWYASNELPMADQTVKFTEAVSQTQWAQFCEAFA